MSDSRSEVRGFDSPYDLWEFLQLKFDAEYGLRYKYHESITKKNPQSIQIITENKVHFDKGTAYRHIYEQKKLNKEKSMHIIA